MYDLCLKECTAGQTTFDAEPSYEEEEDVASTRYHYEAEQPAFGFTERDVDVPTGRHSRNSSAGTPHALY